MNLNRIRQEIYILRIIYFFRTELLQLGLQKKTKIILLITCYSFVIIYIKYSQIFSESR
ncbi:hypothetical protein pb186bvf_014163 [Paramecium bursaria]